jgi:hypothetical protein
MQQRLGGGAFGRRDWLRTMASVVSGAGLFRLVSAEGLAAFGQAQTPAPAGGRGAAAAPNALPKETTLLLLALRVVRCGIRAAADSERRNHRRRAVSGRLRLWYGAGAWYRQASVLDRSRTCS